MSLGGLRLLWQPLRPFLAGTKVTNYVMMKNGDEDLKRRRTHSTNMIQADPSVSPRQALVDLSAPVNLVASSPSLTTCTISTPQTQSSPQVMFDGVTFTANVADFFSVAPTSPSESIYENPEVSLFDDNDDIGKFDDSCTASSTTSSGRCSSVDSASGFIDSELAEAAIQAVQSAPALATAVNSVLETGSMMPLIKEELKYTIQTKRMRNGKTELEVTNEKKIAMKLSPEEVDRRARRRERNKVAAQKCRDKKAERTQELNEEIETLETGNSSLRTELERLQCEIQQLRDMLIRHDKSTQCGHPILRTAEDAELRTPQPKRQKTTKRVAHINVK